MPLFWVYLYLALVAVVYWFRPVSEAMLEAGNDALISVFCLFGSYCLFRVSRSFGKDDSTGRCWMLFSAGMFLEGVGHVVYSAQEFTLDEAMTFPNIADVLIVVGGFCYIASLFLFNRELSQLALIPENSRKWIANAIIAIIILLTFVFIVYPVITDESETIAMRAMLQVYPVIDALLAYFCIHILLAFLSMGYAPVAKPWFILVFAFLLFMVTDSAYAYMDVIGHYHPYLFINPGWGLSYLLLANAAYEQRKVMA